MCVYKCIAFCHSWYKKYVRGTYNCLLKLSRPVSMCTILFSLDGPKVLLVLQGFVLLTWHQASWEKASCTLREGTPYEPGSGRSLKRCGIFGLLPHPHPQRRAILGLDTICNALPPCARYCPLRVARRLSSSLKVLFFSCGTKSCEKRPHAH